MNKQELINRYTEKLLTQSNSLSQAVQESRNAIFRNVIADLESLDEPQKVKVPVFVAEWIEICKENADLCCCLNGYYETSSGSFVRPKSFSEAFYDWLADYDHMHDLARAYMDGYEVEEEPKYQVKLKFGRQYLSKNADGNMLDFYSCMVFPPSFSKKELESIEDGAFYKADGDKEWINPIIELVPVEKV